MTIPLDKRIPVVKNALGAKQEFISPKINDHRSVTFLEERKGMYLIQVADNGVSKPSKYLISKKWAHRILNLDVIAKANKLNTSIGRVTNAPSADRDCNRSTNKNLPSRLPLPRKRPVMRKLAAKTDFRDFCRKAKAQASQSKVAIRNRGKIPNGHNDGEKQFRGCRHDIGWMQRTRSILCKTGGSLSSITPPKNIVFVFDGAMDFNAQKANEIMNIANLDGSEGKDLGKGRMGGGRTILNELKDQTSIPLKEMQVHYHASSGFHLRENYSSALACAQEMDMYLDTLAQLQVNFKQPKIVAIGYSNGGVDVIRFQNDMAKKLTNRPTHLALTVDPVAKIAGFLFKQNNTHVGSRHPNTKRFINIYQNKDHGSMKFLKLRGKPVNGADENLLVNSKNSLGMGRDGGNAHVDIIRTSIVENTLRCELAKLSLKQDEIAKKCLKDPFTNPELEKLLREVLKGAKRNSKT